jgi:predicted lipid-binding transport protein (Tim44 family)
MAGGFLGSMLFRSLGWGAPMGMGGGGGIGLLEILLIAGLGFMLFRMIIGRAATANQPSAGWQPPISMAGYGAQGPRPVPSSSDLEDSAVAELQRFDQAFDPSRFKDERVDGFFQLQAAWGERDLGRVAGLLTPELKTTLDVELVKLRNARRVNHLENVTVRETRLVEAWQEFGKEYVTMLFRANLLDYTIDESSGAVVEGDRHAPVKFEEYWTFMRQVGAPGTSWRLSAVEPGNA